MTAILTDIDKEMIRLIDQKVDELVNKQAPEHVIICPD